MDIKEFEENLDKVYSDIKKVLIEKNKSYGFSVFKDSKLWNTIGIVTRIGDKENRLKHLLQKYIDTGDSESPFGESIDDTIMDLLGYALLLEVNNRKMD